MRTTSLDSVDEGEAGSQASSSRNQQRRPYKGIDLDRLDVATARDEAKSLVDAVYQSWTSGPVNDSTSSIRPMLIDTAQAIRRVRTLALLLASHSREPSNGSTPKSKRQGFSVPSRPNSLPVPPPDPSQKARRPRKESQELTDLRRTALEVLAALRALEEDLRQQATETLSLEALSPTLSSSEMTDPDAPSTAPTSIRPPSVAGFSDTEALDQDDDGYNVNLLAQGLDRHVQTWEERLVDEERDYGVPSDWEQATSNLRQALARWSAAVEAVFTAATTSAEVAAWAEESWEGSELGKLMLVQLC